MRKDSIYLKWLIVLVLALIPSLCLAAETMPSSPLWDMFQNLSFTPSPGDMSVGYLAKLFGTVPGVPALVGAGPTIVGVVFGVFNAGVLALSGVFLSYTITRVLTETTMDGAALGKSTTIWTAVRCALSTSLLVPQASGYSMINGIVMWVVIQSVGLADFTWNNAMDYLKKGVPVYAPSTGMMDYSLINYDIKLDINDNPDANKINITNLVASAGATDVLRSLTCAHIVHDALVNSQSIKHQNLAKKITDGGTLTPDEQLAYANSTKTIPEDSGVFSIYKDFQIPDGCASGGSCQSGAFQFPNVNNEATNPLKDYGLNLRDVDIPKNLSGLCGTISYFTAGGDQRSKDYTAAKWQGLQDMIILLDPTAKAIVKGVFSAMHEESQSSDPTILNPTKYVVYNDTDGTKHYLGDQAMPGLVSDMVGRYVSDPSNAGYTLPIINWPLGADDVLSAAAAYQVALSVAQIGAAGAVTTAQQKVFDDAKKQGWIAAGNYYRVLSIAQENVQKEYDSYRLTGLANLDVPFKDNNNMLDRNFFLTLFPKSLFNMDKEDPIHVLDGSDGSYRGVLNVALGWINDSYPYSVLHGKVIAISSGLAQTKSGVNLGKEVALISTGVAALAHVFSTAVALSAAILDFGPLYAAPPIGIALIVPVPAVILASEVVSVVSVWAVNLRDSNIDPIIRLQNLGDAMMGAAVDYARSLTILYTGIAITAAYTEGVVEAEMGVAAVGSLFGISLGGQNFWSEMGKGYNEVLEIGQTIIFMSLPFGLAVMLPMFVCGATFSIYVPLIPLMLFLFGAISWLISVLVLMAAAPIICFLMLWGNSSQENPLLAQEAEQFVKQVVGVFFRPTLMIIGLIVGMVLSYIGVDLLNLAFGKIFDIILEIPETFDWGSTSAFVGRIVLSPETFIVRMAGVLVVYTFTMVSIVNMCFSTIYLLYAEVMKVATIGAPALGLEQAQLEGVKTGVTEYAQALGGGLKEATTSGKGLITKVSGGGGGGGGGSEGASAEGEGGEDAAKEVTQVAAML